MLKQIAAECYLPLIKLIKSRRNHKFTLDIPLSLLELMDRFGYKDWIADVRALYESDRVELTGSGAYHPLLTEIPTRLVEEQISLNEYGLGYYFGSTQGFEGEPSIMIKNIQGFFPPELAVSGNLVQTLSSFGYKWFLSEKTALPLEVTGKDSVFEIKDTGVKIVCRDRELSNLISFKRDLLIDDVSSYLLAKNDEKARVFIALDGEYFGHHYKEGLYLLESILDKMDGLGIHFETVSSLIDGYECPTISAVSESSWGASDEDCAKGDIYPFWLSKDNVLQVKLWELQNIMVSKYLEHEIDINSNEFQNIAIWRSGVLKSIEDEQLRNILYKYILIHKYIHSDKFWWSSKKEILGKFLYHPGLVKASLSLVDEMFNCCPNDEAKSQAMLKISEIKDLLK